MTTPVPDQNKQYWSIQRVPLPEQQFFVYSYTKKLSTLGFQKHNRILLLDSSKKTLQYYHCENLQLPLLKIPSSPKEKIVVSSSKNRFKFEPTYRSIGGIIVQWIDQGKQKKWYINMFNNEIMQQWIEIVYQVSKNSYKKNYLSIIKPTPPPQKDKTKYQTEFTKQIKILEYQSKQRTPQQKKKLYQLKQQQQGDQWLSKQAQRKQRIIMGQRQRSKTFGPFAASSQERFITQSKKSVKAQQIKTQKQNDKVEQQGLVNAVSASTLIRKSDKKFAQVQPLKPKVPNEETKQLQLTQLQLVGNTFINLVPPSPAQSERKRKIVKKLFQTNTINKIYVDKYEQQHKQPISLTPRSHISPKSTALRYSLTKKKQFDYDWLQFNTYSQTLQNYSRFCLQCQAISKNVIQILLNNPKNLDQFRNQVIKQKRIKFFIGTHYLNQSSPTFQKPYLEKFLIQCSYLLHHQQIKQQFLSYEFMFRVSNRQALKKQFKNNFQVPYTCIIEYLSFAIFFRVDVEHIAEQQVRSQNQSSKYIRKISQNIKMVLPNDFARFYRHQKQIVIEDLQPILPKHASKLHQINEYTVTLPYQAILALSQSTQIINPTTKSIITFSPKGQISIFDPNNKNSTQTIHNSLLNNINAFLQTVTNRYIVNSIDFRKILNQSEFNLGYLPYLYRASTTNYHKRLFLSEMAVICLIQIIQQSFFNQIIRDNSQSTSRNNIQILQFFFLDRIFHHLQQLLNRSQEAQNMITRTIHERFDIELRDTKQIDIGYLMNGVISLKNIQYEAQDRFIALRSQFSRKCLKSMKPFLKKYSFVNFGENSQKLLQKLRDQPNQKQFQNLIELTKNCPIIFYQKQLITEYIAYYTPPKDQLASKFNLYSTIKKQPATAHSVKMYQLYIKWMLKKKQYHKAQLNFENCLNMMQIWLKNSLCKIQLNDVYSMHLYNHGNFRESIRVAEKSVEYTAEFFGQKSFKLSDKLYGLAELYYKLDCLPKALQAYVSTQYILQLYNQERIPQFINIMIKQAKIYLELKNEAQCIRISLQALRMSQQSNFDNYDVQMQIYELMCRTYEAKNQYYQVGQISLVCIEKHWNSKIPYNIRKQMVKLYVTALMLQLSQYQKQALTKLISLVSPSKHTEKEAMVYLSKLKINELLKLDQICKKSLQLSTKFVNRQRSSTAKTGIVTSFRSSNPLEQYMILLDVITLVVGESFMIGFLGQY